MWFLMSMILIVATGLLMIYYFIFGPYDRIREQKIDKRFHEELKTLPNVAVKKFTLWEGDGFSSIDIKNKGQVHFQYSVAGIPYISAIGGKSTYFNCVRTDKTGKKTEFSHAEAMVLTKDSPFSKWFPFEVRSLHDLVNRYDDILKIVNTFPKKSIKDIDTVNEDGFMFIKDNHGTHKVLIHSDPYYSYTPKDGGVCDIYIRE